MKKQITRNTFTGKIQATKRGFAFIVPDDREKYKYDFFLPHDALCGALNGDRVLASHVRGTKDEARIIKILERGTTRLVGTFERYGKSAKLYPDDLKMPEINIPLALSDDAKSGDKLLCEITNYPKNGGRPTAKVIENLGESGDFDTEELSIIRTYGLYETFPEEVIGEAQTAASLPVTADGRTDLREKLIFTVDGADTRDIDDAISLETDGDKYILGVHIADVSNYVEYDSELDREAYLRGTSVYFPDRVLPMLPKELSNGICSLNEGEDRLTLSCVMTFDANGNKLDSRIFESIICSRHKMTYPTVTAICEGDNEACGQYPDLVETLCNMRKLCLLLEQKRNAAGCINLDVSEIKIHIDEDGEITVNKAQQGISERIIEQFMIAANESVAQFLQKNKAPCLYRIHESPSKEKAEILLDFLKNLGINARCNTDSPNPAEYQKILLNAANKPYFSQVNKVLLKSMQKARYCGKNAGHFGLASQCYCHFTSPIRRYPDLFVHRSVKAVLHGNYTALKDNAECIEDAGTDCSERERIADEAERSVEDLYKTVYMSDHIGEVFDATVSGVTNFGVFCELNNGIEGLIPFETLSDDSYEYIAERFLLKGKRHTFRLGDRVKIVVDNCDFGRMRTIFSLY